jgi:hypothetical protein
MCLAIWFAQPIQGEENGYTKSVLVVGYPKRHKEVYILRAILENNDF